jgi:hypothetical protein
MSDEVSDCVDEVSDCDKKDEVSDCIDEESPVVSTRAINRGNSL